MGPAELDEGRGGDSQVIPAAAIESIAGGGSHAAFRKSDHPGLVGWSYRGLVWNTENNHGAYAARGVYGQTVYVDPVAEMVIARFASYPEVANAANDPTFLPAYSAIAVYLMASGDGSGDGSSNTSSD